MAGWFLAALFFVYNIEFSLGIHNGMIVAKVEKYEDNFMVIKPYSKEFPFMTEILLNNEHLCGGSLISLKVVITAAHCFPSEDTFDLSPYELIVGNQLRESKSGPTVQWSAIKRVVQHRNYTGDAKRDIALVQAAKEFIENDYVRPIKLPRGFNRNSFKGHFVVQLGWGYDETGQLTYPLLKMDAFVRVTRGCADKPHEHNLLCTKGLHNAVLCSGDSGGPVLIHHKHNFTEDVLVAVHSSGFDVEGAGICDVKKPTVDVNVVMFLDWIDETIKNYFSD